MKNYLLKILVPIKGIDDVDARKKAVQLINKKTYCVFPEDIEVSLQEIFTDKSPKKVKI